MAYATVAGLPVAIGLYTAFVPMVIYAGTLWAVGLGGGYALAFNLAGDVPLALRGASGFWMAATVSLVLASLAMTSFMAWVLKTK